MIIEVTQKHIEHGIRKSPCSCPIALAMREAGVKSVAVLGPTCEFQGYYTKSSGTRIPMNGRRALPLDARAFIRQFDNGQEVKPFSFEFFTDIPNGYK